MKMFLPGNVVVDGTPQEIIEFITLNSAVADFERDIRQEFARYLLNQATPTVILQ